MCGICLRVKESAAEVAQRVALRSVLKNQVNNFLTPYLHQRTDPPPIALGEMIVMALLDSDKPHLTSAGIMEWLSTKLAYYRLKAGRPYANVTTSADTASSGAVATQRRSSMFVPGLDRALAHADLPFQKRACLWNLHEHPAARSVYTVDPEAAQSYLQHRLAPTRTGAFPFLELPPELRNRIYELLFSFSTGSGLRFSFSNKVRDVLAGRSCTLGVMQPGIAVARHQRYGIGRSPTDDDSPMPPMVKVLALLSVCQQIHQEALPFFYSLNTFVFPEIPDMVRWFRFGPASRISELTSLHLRLRLETWTDADAICDFPAATESLKSVRHLKQLKFQTSDSDWLQMERKHRAALSRTGAWKTIEQIPGMMNLAILASKADEVVFLPEIHGRRSYTPAYTKFEEFITTEAEKIKNPASPVIAGAKKRKAAGSAAVGKTVVKRAKKKTA